MKKLILSLFFLSAFTLRGSAQLQGLEVVKVPEAQQPYSCLLYTSPSPRDCS